MSIKIFWGQWGEPYLPGQFCEIEGDCVFTTGYSVRSAITAVYTLLNLDKKVPQIYPSQYDIRPDFRIFFNQTP
jgi:myosin-crossreactive antigen